MENRSRFRFTGLLAAGMAVSLSVAPVRAQNPRLVVVVVIDLMRADYMPSLPAWMDRFNREHRVENYRGREWRPRRGNAFREFPLYHPFQIW